MKKEILSNTVIFVIRFLTAKCLITFLRKCMWCIHKIIQNCAPCFYSKSYTYVNRSDWLKYSLVEFCLNLKCVSDSPSAGCFLNGLQEENDTGKDFIWWQSFKIESWNSQYKGNWNELGNFSSKWYFLKITYNELRVFVTSKHIEY